MGYVHSIMRRIYHRLGRDGRAAATIGSGLLSMVAMFQYKFNESINHCSNNADVTCTNKLFYIRGLFGRTRSRLTGAILDKQVPPSWRLTLYPVIGRIWGCDLSECRYPLDSYKCVGHLFARTLKHGCRTVQDKSQLSMVSPVDGTVLKVGDVTESRIEQVKGTTFNIKAFLGCDALATAKKGLKYVVLYLSPDKYHHFHSPCSFAIHNRKHFTGEVLPVFSSFLKRLNDVFAVNERVVYGGRWAGGAMYYAAIAAYNVGNIRLAHEPMFRSNNLRTQLYYLGGDIDIDWKEQKEDILQVSRGEHLGEFRLGSTVVLVFEATDDLIWNVKEGDNVEVGQRLAGATPLEAPSTPWVIGYSADTSMFDKKQKL
eukprot:GHVS01043818.1.p1 GENE.GHVS01043818.1~~GHVS01043818.1.p1  ORF type:complete len:371 (-),score=38.40 GHVS01043818.1:49-1161(-)